MSKQIKASVKNRAVCSVLQEMRDYLDVLKIKDTQRDFFKTLIEEAQTYVNRMEAAIYDHKDVLALFEDYSKLTAAIRKKKSELRKLEAKDGKD